MTIAIADVIRARWPSLSPDAAVELLPATPDAIEVHVRAAGDCDLVVGYNGRRFPELSSSIARIAGEQGPLWERWVASSGEPPMDAGAQLGRGRIQTYLRGHYTAADIERAAAAAGVPYHRALVANTLALFATDNAEMIGLDLGSRVAMAIYLAVRNIEEERAALGDAIGYLAGAMCSPDEAKRWRAVCGPMLRTVTEEFVYVSFSPDAAHPWVKIDAGARPVALASMIARELGIDATALVSAATTHQVQTAAHVGLRLHGGAPELSIYCPIL